MSMCPIGVISVPPKHLPLVNMVYGYLFDSADSILF